MMKNNVFTAAAAAIFCTIFLLTACKKSTSPEGSCQDGIQNQGETGIDCGGPCAACMTKKDSVIADYRDYYLGSELTDPAGLERWMVVMPERLRNPPTIR